MLHGSNKAIRCRAVAGLRGPGILDGSASAFRNSDFNGCLNNARVALQTLASSIARERLREHPGSFDEKKWVK